jgi:hypothetical protein
MDLNLMLQTSKPELLNKVINLDDNFCIRKDPNIDAYIFKDYSVLEDKIFSKNEREDELLSEAFDVLNRKKMNNELDENGEKTYDFLFDKIYKQSLNLNMNENSSSENLSEKRNEAKKEENEIIIEKESKEPLNNNLKESIFSKNPFEEKKNNILKVDEIMINKKSNDVLNLNLKENITSKIPFGNRNNDKEKKGKIIFDKKYKESMQLKIKENIRSKSPFKEIKILGRKKKNHGVIGEHNKFSDDNIIRKIKHVILESVMNFINNKIRIICPNKKGKALKEKELFKLKQNQPMNSRTKYNKDFLDKKLEEIFSLDISSKYSRYDPTHNKDVINSLINDPDETRSTLFTKIFNLTFVECLNHFRGSKKIKDLDGLSTLEDYIKEKKKDQKDEEYYNLFKFFVDNFETLIMEKKSRNRVKK